MTTNDVLDALREAADLRGLLDALLRRGEDALERGAWRVAQTDLDEAAAIATLAGQPVLAARANRGAALAYKADGQLAAAARRAR